VSRSRFYSQQRHAFGNIYTVMTNGTPAASDTTLLHATSARTPLYSHWFTLLYQVVYPTVIGVVCFVFVVLGVVYVSVKKVPPTMPIVMSVLWLTMLISVIVHGSKFKRVWLHGDALEVSTRSKAITIPLASISLVELTHPYDRPRRIRIRFRTLAGGSDAVMFIPVDGRLVSGGTETAAYLRRLVQQAQGR